MSEHRTSEELKAIEAALGSLVPRQGGMDRDRLMYRAGAASVARRSARWMWPAATATMTLLSVTLAVSLVGRGEPRVVERIKYVTVDGPTKTTPDPSPRSISMNRRQHVESMASSGNYLRLRRLVLAGGVEALPPPPARRGDGIAGPSPITNRDSLLKQLRES